MKNNLSEDDEKFLKGFLDIRKDFSEEDTLCAICALNGVCSCVGFTVKYCKDFIKEPYNRE